jgi:hypothetical protein
MQKIRLFFLFFVGFMSTEASAQRYFSATEEEFGANRIQTKRFDWLTVRTANFEVNYYRGGEPLALKSAKMLENEYKRITDILGYTPFSAMKVFIYTSPRDLEQSNMGLLTNNALDGSIMNVARSRVQIAFKGNDEAFDKALLTQVTDLFLYDMLFGGSLKEVLQSSLMLTLPEWFMKGISGYVATDFTNETVKEQVIAAIARNEQKKLSTLEGDDAQLIGASIWNYIAVRYGKDNISSVLNLTRIIRTEQSSITSTLGVSFTTFLKEWRNFYLVGPPDVKLAQLAENKETKLSSSVSRLGILKEGEVDTDNYSFDAKNIERFLAQTKGKMSQPVASKVSQETKKEGGDSKEVVVRPPKAFTNMLIPGDLVTTFVNDPVRRLGMKNQLVLNDLLENHIINLSLYVSPTIRSHDIKAFYENLTQKIDWRVGFERRSIALDQVDFRSHFLFRPLQVSLPENNTLFFNRRVLDQRVYSQASYPLSQKMRLTGKLSVANITDVDYNDLTKDILQTTFFGASMAWVYDNTEVPYVNFPVGTKMKVILDRQYSVNRQNQGFDRLMVDLRRYQKVAPGVVLAARASVGLSQGADPKYTFLGGTENWINRQVQTNSGQNIGIPLDLRDLAFYNFAGSLRGFNFGKMYGHNHVLANIELRFSMADLLAQNAAVSNALRNLQLVIFDDFGAAWNGTKGPFSRQNSLNTEIIGGGTNPFRAEVTNFKNPFLMGYGVGARTTILGYFIRFDYAWGIEDKVVSRPVLHFSLGHDF